jgi:hypothetical protein
MGVTVPILVRDRFQLSVVAASVAAGAAGGPALDDYEDVRK